MLARAKINLALHVTGQRTDGYHRLESLVGFADFGDALQVTPSQHDHLRVDGPFGTNVPALDQNTLGKALAVVRRWGRDPLASAPVSITLTKNLPVASGIGGGSADAAALIALLSERRKLSLQERDDALALGADVPMCLAGQSALIGGIGEVIKPVSLPACALVLANPGVSVETPSVFRALSEKTNAPLPDWDTPKDFADLVGYLKNTRNDLMTPAISLAPEISRCLDALSGAAFSRMSGSGATCFALCATEDEALNLATKTQNAHPNWWVRAGKLANT